MPEQWLSCVLEEIKSCNPSSTLCATRRSAGIPFYIQVPNDIIMPDLIHFFLMPFLVSMYVFSTSPPFGAITLFYLQILVVFVQPGSQM